MTAFRITDIIVHNRVSYEVWRIRAITHLEFQVWGDAREVLLLW